MTNKKKVKVKSFIRKGKIVKGYDRNQEIKNKILTGLGGAAVGAGLVGAGVLIGKGKSPKVVQQIVNADDIAKQVISKLPKQEVVKINADEIIEAVSKKVNQQKVNTDEIIQGVISKLPKQKDINVDEIVEAVSKKVNQQKVNTDEIVSEILNKLPKQPIVSSQSSSITSVTGNLLEDISIRKVKLPTRIDGLSKKKIDNLTKNAQEISNEQLEKTISKLSSNLSKYQESLTDVVKVDELNKYLDNLKPENLEARIAAQLERVNKNIPSAYRQAKERAIENTESYKNLMYENIIKDLAPYFKINVKNKDDIDRLVLNNTKFGVDQEYRKNLKKLINRRKSELDIYQSELSKRNAKEVGSASSDSIDRMRELLDDFSSNNKLITFARKKGSKDKKKRKQQIRNNIIKASALGAAGGAISNVLQEGIKATYNKTFKKGFSKRKLVGNIGVGIVLGAIGEGVAKGIIEKYKDSKIQNKKVNKILKDTGNFNNVNFAKEEVKVKSFIRKGRIVKAHRKKIDKKNKNKLKIAAGIVAGVGLTAALANNHQVRVVLASFARANKNRFTKINRLKIKDIKNIATNNEELLNLSKNAKSVKNTTNKVFFVDDISNGNTYIYKENVVKTPWKVGAKLGYGTYTVGNEQAAEAISSELGEQIGIKIQSTKIISGNQIFDGKTPKVPGSIHSVAKGQPIYDIPEFKGRHFAVSHIAHNPSNKQIVDDFFMQKDIAQISALDTFIGNADRNPNNLFYDLKTKSFTAIDNGSAYSYPFDYRKMKKAIYSQYSRMTNEQKNNLKVYRDTLKKLIDENSPESLSKKYDDYFIQAMKGVDEKVVEKALTSRDARIRNMFRSYRKSKELIEDIDKLLGI